MRFAFDTITACYSFFFLSLNHVKSFRLVSYCHKGTETMCMYLVIEAKKVICEARIISRKKVFPFRYSCFFFFFYQTADFVLWSRSNCYAVSF